MNKKILLPMILMITMLIGACATPTVAPSPAPLTFTDGLKRTVKLTKPAQRIVSLAPSTTEMLFAVGAGKQVVGRDKYSDYPAETKSITAIIDTFPKVNLEAVVALKPDLVIAASIINQEQIKAMEDNGLTVFLVGNPKTFDDLYQTLVTVGQLTAHDAEAKKLSDGLKERVKVVNDKVKSVTKKPKVYYELDATDPLKPYTAGSDTFIDLLIVAAGGENAVTFKNYAQISSEELVKQNPDIILLGDAKFGTTVESVGKRAGWSAIAAVKNNKVIAFDDDLASRPGPRLVDGLETMAKVFQPDLFK